MTQNTEYLRTLIMDDGAVKKRSLHIEQERSAALGDLLRDNSFTPLHDNAPLRKGAYDAHLSIEDNRLRFALTSDTLTTPHLITIPVSAFRSIIKDYFLICENYFEAIKTADPYKLEAIDMARRGVHNEGSEKLQTQLQGKAEIDFNTARRIFTLMCVLHIK